MASTFPTTIKPTTDSTFTVTPLVNRAQFNNGYAQLSGKGINTMLETWNVTFKVNKTDYETIITLFRNSAGYISFNWTSPTSTSAQLFRCSTWSTSCVGRVYIVTATFEQSAEIV